jgi:hypothetical protein
MTGRRGEDAFITLLRRKISPNGRDKREEFGLSAIGPMRLFPAQEK